MLAGPAAETEISGQETGGQVMIKSINYIVLPASDLKRTIAFYCDALGMELQQLMPPDGSAERLTLVFGQ